MKTPDNAVRLMPGDPKGHVESFFVKANDPEGGLALWIKYTLLVPKGGEGGVGEVWAILFDSEGGHRGAKASFPLDTVILRDGGIGLKMGESAFSPGHARGAIAGVDGEPFSWDLRFDGERRPLRPFPYGWMYTAPFPKSKSLTPTSDTRLTGVLRVGDREVRVEGWPGMQGHNWGRSHAERYAWAHCNVFEDRDGEPVDAVFEGFSAQIRLGPVVTPFLTACVLLVEGEPNVFTAPLSWVRADTYVHYTSWELRCRQGGREISGRVYTARPDMVGLTYQNPTGDPMYCLNSKIAAAELRLLRPGQPPLRLRSPGKAALEVTVREPNHGVEMLL